MHKSYNPIRCVMALIAMFACLGGAAQQREMLRVTKNDGTVEKHELSKISKIAFATEDLTPKPHVGDFYYTDGTWSTVIDDNKTVAGVVFAIGDPTQEDPVLRADHPECTHGWVVAAYADQEASAWQTNMVQWGKEVQTWLSANRPNDLHIASHYGQDTYRNMAIGYSNTQSITQFNLANPDYAMDPVQNLASYSASHPTPATCSGWYMPSVKEAFMIISGIPDNDEILMATKSTANRITVDNSLVKILGATLLNDPTWAYVLWTTMEFDDKGYGVEVMSSTIEGVGKSSAKNCKTRYILAF